MLGRVFDASYYKNADINWDLEYTKILETLNTRRETENTPIKSCGLKRSTVLAQAKVQSLGEIGKLPLEKLRHVGYSRDGFSGRSWKRPRHMDFTLFAEGGPSYDDVIQIGIGNCWLMS